MSASTATGQHSKPDMLAVTLIHQSLRIETARLASALAVGPGDRPRRVAAIGAFYGQYRAQLADHGGRPCSGPFRRCGCSTGSLCATTAGSTGRSPAPPGGRDSRRTRHYLRGGHR